jgi:hypothetical protein
LWASGCSGASEDGRGARTFASPEEAVEALTEAGETDDTEALQALFGQGAEDLLSSGDSVSDRNQREVVTLALRQRWNLEETETGERSSVTRSGRSRSHWCRTRRVGGSTSRREKRRSSPAESAATSCG